MRVAVNVLMVAVMLNWHLVFHFWRLRNFWNKGRAIHAKLSNVWFFISVVS
jgi:hypothetical protein